MAPETPDQSVPSPGPTASSSDSDSGCALEDYLNLKPHSSSLSCTLSSSDTEELKFVRTLLQLLPPQDSDEKFCTTLGELERRELQKFSTYRRVHSMRHGAIVRVTVDLSDSCCMRCGCKILVGDTVMCADGAQDENLRWHLKCFVCETCHLPLSQFIYFLQDNRIYCGRHHAELTRARCAACDQLIMSETCTVAEGLYWHVEHFCCWDCEKVLSESRYLMKSGRPFCSSCFLRLHAESCEACGEPVDPDGELVTLKGQYWYTLPSCFCCFSCRMPLYRLQFMIHNDRLYCSQQCVSIASRMRYPSKYWSDMVRASAANCNPQIHCSPLSNSTMGSNCKQIKPSVHETCSIPRCEKVLPRLFVGTEREPRKSWLMEDHQMMEGEEDTSCSSSDSEPEGFFLGRPIPNYSPSRGTNLPVDGKSTFMRRSHRDKSCKVS